jgi:hypothetical protein
VRALVEQLHERSIREAVRLSGAGGVLTIRADTASESIAVSKLVLGRLPASARIAAVDVTRCGSTSAFCMEFARGVVSLYLGGASWLEYPQEQWPADVSDGLLELGDATGGGLIRAVLTPRSNDDDGSPELFAVAVDALVKLSATGRSVVLAVLGADELVPQRARRNNLDGVDELLWTLRARLQHAIAEPGLMFAGSDIIGELTASEGAAFFGWGTEIALRNAPRLAETIGRVLANNDVVASSASRWATEIEERSQGSVPTAERLMELTLSESRAGAVDVAAVAVAWRRLSEVADQAYRQQARSLRSLDRLALAVAIAIAHGRPPYGVGRFPSGPNKALARLHETGFVAQHEPRSWHLTDPVFASWLRESAVASRPELGRPALWILRRSPTQYLVTDGASLSNVRSTHRTSAAAQRAADSIAKDARGADVMIIDSDDPDDFPSWALPALDAGTKF